MLAAIAIVQGANEVPVADEAIRKAMAEAIKHKAASTVRPQAVAGLEANLRTHQENAHRGHFSAYRRLHARPPLQTPNVLMIRALCVLIARRPCVLATFASKRPP